MNSGQSPFGEGALFLEMLMEIPSCQWTTYSYILLSQVAGMVQLHDIKEMKHEWQLA
jgi:hypothetical protein